MPRPPPHSSFPRRRRSASPRSEVACSPTRWPWATQTSSAGVGWRSNPRQRPIRHRQRSSSTRRRRRRWGHRSYSTQAGRATPTGRSSPSGGSSVTEPLDPGCRQAMHSAHRDPSLCASRSLTTMAHPTPRSRRSPWERHPISLRSPCSLPLLAPHRPARWSRLTPADRMTPTVGLSLFRGRLVTGAPVREYVYSMPSRHPARTQSVSP